MVLEQYSYYNSDQECNHAVNIIHKCQSGTSQADDE